MKKGKLSIYHIIFIVFIFSYLINLFWEVAHSLLYNWSQFPLSNDVYFYIPKILKATLGDAFIISFIFLINSFFRKKTEWVYSIRKNDYLAFILLGLIFAVIIEIRALMLNLWSYNSYMPTILGIGLTPLIQLSITGIITLFFIKKFLLFTAP